MIEARPSSARLAPPPTIRDRPIEDLLRWCYRDELPKDRDNGAARFRPEGFGHAWGSVAAYGELLAVVDDGCGRNRWGVVPFDGAVPGEPHPDALAVANAVLDLDGLALDLPEPWEPLADLGDLGELGAAVLTRALDRISAPEPDGSRRLTVSLRALVFRHACLGAPPVWEAEVPEIRTVSANGRAKWFVTKRVEVGENAFGEPIFAEREFDGYDARGKRPVKGAYQKRYLEPDPTDAAVARAHWELWRAALDVLVEDLARPGVLREHRALPSTRPTRPWEGEPERCGVVLRDLSEPVPVGRERTGTKKPRLTGLPARSYSTDG